MKFYNALSLVLVILCFGFLFAGQFFKWNADSAATGAVIAALTGVTTFYFGRAK